MLIKPVTKRCSVKPKKSQNNLRNFIENFCDASSNFIFQWIVGMEVEMSLLFIMGILSHPKFSFVMF